MLYPVESIREQPTKIRGREEMDFLIRLGTKCYKAFCDACNGSGFDCFEGQPCDECQGAGEVELCREA